jgi:hypothetical protein
VEVSELYFTSAPNQEEAFQVGDRIEVYCDHDEEGDRVRNWLIGTVVQVDPKMIAVQFEENVYLTDGWMVPDHVLWCPKESINVRKVIRRRRKPTPKAAKPIAKPVSGSRSKKIDNDDFDDEL